MSKLSFILMMVLCAAVGAEAAPRLGSQQQFWVPSNDGTYRKANATLIFAGDRTLVFVEEGQTLTSDPYTLIESLEHQSPGGAMNPGGLLYNEERLLGPLPKLGQHEDHLIILFADIENRRGFFHPYDQWTETEAAANFAHSNETNLIYLSANGGSKILTVARELQRLLSYSKHASPIEPWFSETIAQGTLLYSGYFDQAIVNDFSAVSAIYSLISDSPNALQLLFAAFLSDLSPGPAAIGFLAHSQQKGREAVEIFFRSKITNPLPFDAIFSGFISYVFENAGTNAALPKSNRVKNSGVLIPAIGPYVTLHSFPAQVVGEILPYSIAAVDLEADLPATAIVEVERLPADDKPSNSCANTASVLWKPIHPRRLAIYAVGCEYQSNFDLIRFRLKILDRPFLLPQSPLKLAL